MNLNTGNFTAGTFGRSENSYWFRLVKSTPSRNRVAILVELVKTPMIYASLVPFSATKVAARDRGVAGKSVAVKGSEP